MPTTKPVPVSSTADPNHNLGGIVHPTAAHNVYIMRGCFALVAGLAALILMVAVYGTIQIHILSSSQLKLQTTTTVSTSTTTTTTTTTSRHAYLYILLLGLVYTLIIALFVAMRLGTLRVQSATESGIVYNHRETDERVFEVCVHLCLDFDYMLSLAACSFCFPFSSYFVI